MVMIYFVIGLCFGGLALAAYLQLRQGGDFALKRQLPWLAAFGAFAALTSWIDMFLASGSVGGYAPALIKLRMVVQPMTGLLLLIFGWRILRDLTPLPAWAIFIPGILIVPISYVMTYAATTFVTPSPIEIPIDIWSRYLLYLPGAIMAGIGFLRQWRTQRSLGLRDVAGLMLGTGLAFLFEAFVVGLVVPAAPYGPASYYNYDRVINNAFRGEQAGLASLSTPVSAWLDYQSILNITGLPIQFWRMISALTVTFFMVRGLGVFEALRKRQVQKLQEERDRAQRSAFDAQIAARQVAESWRDALVSINRRIMELEDVDSILLYIVERARALLQADFVALGLFDDSGSDLELKCFSAPGRNEFVTERTPITNRLVLEALRSVHAYRSTDNDPPELFDSAGIGIEQDIHAIVVVSLALDGRPVGAIWMGRLEPRPFTETDLIWLECMADQVIIAIQHGLMTEQLQSYSITEERARIAREMHDGLAQVLGYLNLEVQTLDALLQQGKKDAIRTELGQMRDAVRVANDDVRENILSLRTTLANKKGLVSAIDEYLSEFGIQTGIQTEFDNRVAGDLDLASLAEVQLVCILQEALANVRKHAGAASVSVRIEKRMTAGEEFISMRITDDGVGFAARDTKRNFGLQTMRERARSVQGTLIVHSAPGKGTTIESSFPCLPQRKLPRNQWDSQVPDAVPVEGGG
ncbi:MAG TPA: histidine kinase [Anaerolineales bacterium]|nr:histidine kinase [Anaerolineales bacterium]